MSIAQILQARFAFQKPIVDESCSLKPHGRERR